MSDLVGTPAQVAEALETCEKTIRALKESDRGFPWVPISRHRWVVPWAALHVWLAEQATQANGESWS